MTKSSIFFSSLCLLFIPLIVSAEDKVDIDAVVKQLSPAIEEAMAAGNIPSLSIALVDRNSILWHKAFGYANVLKKVPAETDTMYLIGSTFKAQSTFALLQLVDEKKIALKDPVSKHLNDISIKGEDPDHPIRIWHLLTHSSGLTTDFGPHDVWGFSAPAATETYLKRALRVERKPEEKYEYSNRAYQLIAHIIEEVSGVPYRKYIQERLWDRLDMTEMTFSPRPNQYERMSIPYLFDDETKKRTPATWVKANIWAAGMVYGTIDDQAKWMMTNLNRGVYKDERVLSKKTFKKVMTQHFIDDEMNFRAFWGDDTSGVGLTWWLSEIDGDTHFAHSGSVPGYTAWATGNLTEGFGVVLLTNGHRSHPHLSALADHALTFMTKIE
jgi:CubicO group peptidase (beta-lactamase class C family)